MQEFLEILEQLNPFRGISQERMKCKGFTSKWEDIVEVFAGNNSDSKSIHYGILDWLFLFIPQMLMWLVKQGESGGLHILWRAPLLLPIMIQYLLAQLLTLLLSPFVVLLHWLYPYDENKGRTRRQFFFYPSTWMVGFLLLAGISALLQGIDPITFAQAAAPLVIIQVVFVALAGVMLIGTILHHEIHAPDKKPSDTDKSEQVSVDSNNENSKIPNEATDYLASQTGSYKFLNSLVVTLGIVSVLALLILIIGFFTDGLGLFPGSFVFMAPLFNFMTNGFALSIHNAAALPGLTVLGSISAPTILLTGQILSALTLFSATIFIPDIARHALQTAEEEASFSQDDESRDLNAYWHLLEARRLLQTSNAFNSSTQIFSGNFQNLPLPVDESALSTSVLLNNALKD